MSTVMAAATEFLSHRRIAVAGVSREAAGHGGNLVYQRLRARGYDVFAVNPHADQVEGDPCYHDLASIPGGVDGVVIATRPEAAGGIVDECVRLGIRRVWMHASFGAGSVSPDAAAAGRRAGITVIEGGCPLMFGPTSDFGHTCMRLVLGLTKSAPKV